VLPLRIHQQFLDLPAPPSHGADDTPAAVGHEHDVLRIGEQGFELRAQHARLDRLPIRGLENLDVLPIGDPSVPDLETADCRLRTAYFKNPS
jgi:hypothetical protein